MLLVFIKKIVCPGFAVVSAVASAVAEAPAVDAAGWVAAVVVLASAV
jgi:hypothetical protein